MKRLLRIPIIIRLIGWIFTHMSFLIPVTRLRETSNLIAFHHPSPSYKFHVLIVPKREVASLAQLDPARYRLSHRLVFHRAKPRG